MLRGVLSRLIERLLTIDRLIFMHEAGMGAAYAEEIFDPMISPRSNAIVAALDAPGNGHGEGALCAPCGEDAGDDAAASA